METSKKKMRLTLSGDSMKPAIQRLLKLRKLPLLVQVEVVKMMTPIEQYLLSKCSKKANQMVKNSMPKKNNHEIWVEFDQNFIPLKSKKDIVHFNLKIAENILPIHSATGRFSPEDHRYICDLFRAPPEVYANWQGSRFFPNYLNSPPFPTICAIKRSNLLEHEWSDISLKEFSELHPRQDMILTRGQIVYNLGRNHTFLGASNLMLSSIGGASPFSVLSLFQGKHLLIKDVLIFKFFIEVFVDKWMKEINDNLESVIFTLSPEALIGNLKYEKFSGSGRKYQYDSPIKDYHKFPIGLFDCFEGYEIKREADGKVAIIKTTKDYFMFLVW